MVVRPTHVADKLNKMVKTIEPELLRRKALTLKELLVSLGQWMVCLAGRSIGLVVETSFCCFRFGFDKAPFSSFEVNAMHAPLEFKRPSSKRLQQLRNEESCNLFCLPNNFNKIQLSEMRSVKNLERSRKQ
jgi:hypothetical protein